MHFYGNFLLYSLIAIVLNYLFGLNADKISYFQTIVINIRLIKLAFT